eukprot:CAMPEP_0206190054 /NCGR_PEP_ID=MMETSP0166-20121206/4520_1 /ASSEMBLY_ACC=CAM_ASM_000260 /TAXON_ID=95228 /ORGANISM="Vannella robusta, Strain DIVA3 518/3/11/1/6" /LENGTH=272 /DNA_ID=CAMNT_0053606057 /DNA_START=301 /DNA_END=1116 /DNA_ORIENTATION=+
MAEGGESVEHVAQLIRNANRVVVFSGAGMSAESGISTFRQPEVGVWANKLGLAYFGTPFGWWATPGRAWKTYLHYFRNPIARAKPNAGHLALAELEKLLQKDGKQLYIITQNVDGLHQRAGSSTVFELHGTVYRHVCSKNKHPHEYEIDPVGLDDSDYDPETDEFFNPKKPPRCSHENCSSYLRPDAVLFTESLPNDAWDGAYMAMSPLNDEDVLLVIGTSGVVYPAASIPENAAKRKQTKIIEINPERSALTSTIEASGGIYLQATSAVIL